MAEETTDREEGFMDGVGLIGALMSQSSRDLAYTTNTLIDSANEAALKNAEYGLRLIAMIEKISGGRLTWDEHHTVDHIGTMLLQSLEHHAQMLSKSDNENCRLRAARPAGDVREA